MSCNRSVPLRVAFLVACLVGALLSASTNLAFAVDYSALDDPANDGLIRSDAVTQTSGNSAGTRRIGSSSGAGIGLNTAYFFALPDASQIMSTTQYAMEFYYAQKDGAPTFNTDLYGLGYRPPTPALDGEWFYEGTLDTDTRSGYTPPTGSTGTVDLIAAGVMTPATTPGTRIAVQGGALNPFISSLYADGAIGGDSAVFRLNADVSTQPASIPRSTGYSVVMSNSGGNSGNRATLEAFNLPFAADTFDGLTPGGTIGGATSGVGLNNTAGWIESATQPATVVAPSTPLSFSNSVGTVNGGTNALEIHGTYDGSTPLNNNAARRALETPFGGEELYFRYIVRANPAALDSNDFFVMWLDNEVGVDDSTHMDTSAYLGLRGGDRFFARINSNSSTEAAVLPAGGIVAGEDYMVVGRLYRDDPSDGFNRLDIWLNPEGQDVNLPDDTVLLAGDNTGFNSITHIGFRTGQYTDLDDTFLVDSIALGTSWGQVVPTPEPGSVVALVSGLLLLGLPRLVRRRRERGD